VGRRGFLPGQAVFVAILGFTLNSAAYQAEYIRGAVESVDPLTAPGRPLGRPLPDPGIRFVVFPQALRYAIPGWTNELVYLIKVLLAGGVHHGPELFQAAQGIASTNYRYTALFVLSGLLYLALVVTATTLMEYVRNAVSVPGVSGTGSRWTHRLTARADCYRPIARLVVVFADQSDRDDVVRGVEAPSRLSRYRLSPREPN